ncbi:MAG TPA: hypothetical protein VFO40_28235 [Chthoniobacterales bacterium]|nr:hypothetical protein [Chthoniobacterales bacterium]
MYGRIRWLAGLLILIGLPKSALSATHPDLALAPPPNLSPTAWNELRHGQTAVKTVSLHAQITANRGAITDVTVKESAQLPQTSAEVQSWIKQHWRFVPDFSGTVVQPVSFKIIEGTPKPTPSLVQTVAWKSSGTQIFRSSPKPEFPLQYRGAVRAYIEENSYRRAPGVYLSITVRSGAITDIRVLDQTGPPELCTYTVNWVRRYWVPEPNVHGTFLLPVYYIYGVRR